MWNTPVIIIFLARFVSQMINFKDFQYSLPGHYEKSVRETSSRKAVNFQEFLAPIRVKCGKACLPFIPLPIGWVSWCQTPFGRIYEEGGHLESYICFPSLWNFPSHSIASGHAVGYHQLITFGGSKSIFYPRGTPNQIELSSPQKC